MDKREEDILDDILDGEESELPVIPETLRGDHNDGEETENKEDKNDKNEADKINKPEEESADTPDLSGFLDDNTEVDVDGDYNIDPDLDKELSKFSDDGSEDSEKESKKSTEEREEREKIEKETFEKIARDKKKRFILIRNIAAIFLAVVIVLGGAYLALIQFDIFGIDLMNDRYIMTFDDKKISMEEFKLFLLYNEGGDAPKQSAVDMLIDFLVLEKEVTERNIHFTEENKSYIKLYVDNIQNHFKTNKLKLPKISDERWELIYGISIVEEIRYEILDELLKDILIQTNYKIDEADYAAELASYRSSEKVLKYILTETQEEIQTAYDALLGGLFFEEAVKQYSLAYNEYSDIPTVELSQIGLDEDDHSNIMALKENEYSEIIDLEDIFVIFLVATDKEVEEGFRKTYVDYYQWQVLVSAYDSWNSDAKVDINVRAFDKFDEQKYFDSVTPKE